MQPSSEIYEPWHSHFGDQWATINFYLNMSVFKQEKIRLHHRNDDMKILHQQIIDVLDSPGEIELTSEKWTHNIDGFSVWCGSFFPTKKRWNFNEKHSKIAIQLDGISSAEIKNLKPAEENELQVILSKVCPGFEIVPIGKALGVARSIDVVADSLFFIGVNSGMSLLAYSAGIPAFILEYKLPVITTTCGKAHTVCKGIHDFHNRIKNWVKFLQDIGHPDCQGIRL